MASTTDRVLELVAMRQARRRAFNERLSLLDNGLASHHALLYRCECGLIGCAATIKLSAEDYAAMRAEPRQFAVRADHVIPEVEHVLETRRGHVIVHKERGRSEHPTASSTRVNDPARASWPDRSHTAGS
jgi:hypothetical protein